MTIEKLELGKLNHIYKKLDFIIVQDLLFVFDKINELIDVINILNSPKFITTSETLTEEMIKKWNDHITDSKIKEKQPELLPCPFCGEKPSEATRVLSANCVEYEIKCLTDSCDVNPNVLTTLDRNRALQRWNRRA